jgi:ligand-binding sensor domain-containing protein
LNGSSSSPEGVGRGAGRRRRLWVAAIALLAARPVGALDPTRGLAHYIRDDWGAAAGYAGGAVYGFAQGSDGSLLIAAQRGGFRFDGRSFAAIVPTSGPTGPVLGIASTDGGGFLARVGGQPLVAFRGGHFEAVKPSHNFLGVVPVMAASRDGSILIGSHTLGIIRYRHGRIATVVEQPAMPRIRDRSAYSALVTAIVETDEDIWIGTRDAGLFRFRGDRVEPVVGTLPDPKVNCLLADGSAGVWVGTDRGISRATRAGVVPVDLSRVLGVVPVLGLLRDSDANLWIAAGPHGVIRANGSGVTRIPDWDARSRGMATALFEDRERNVWIGTSKSIERLRDGAFATYSALRDLPSDRIGPIHVDAAGRAWFAPTERGLYWLDGEHARPARVAGLTDDVVYSLDGHEQTVWVGRQYGGLTRLQMTATGPLATRYTEKDGLAQDSVYVVHDPGDGTVWAGTLTGGASHLRHGRFETVTTATGLVSNAVRAIESRGDTVWFGTPDGVSRRAGGEWRSYRTGEGLPSDDVAALLIDLDGNVWAGTSAGLAVLRPGSLRFEQLALVREPVLALQFDQTDALWCATAGRLFRVARRALLAGAATDVREYDVADGLISRESVRRQRTLSVDGRGRVWYATTVGLSVADPARFASGSLPAVLTISGVATDGTPLRGPAPLAIPAGSRRVSVSFAGVSLAVPERIRYRYRLDAFDTGWSAPSTDQTAVYTNLGPGRYTFRVMASDSAGQWSGGEQAIALDVLPAFWQTTTFRVLLLVFAGGLIWIGYRVRLLRVERRLNLRFEARLAERTRIAQDLHDTLLQGVLSASMHLHVATLDVPADSPARGKLAYVHRLMGTVIADGRLAIKGLRAPDSTVGELEAPCRRWSRSWAWRRPRDSA